MPSNDSTGNGSAADSLFPTEDEAKVDLRSADYTIYECLDCEKVVFTVDTTSGPSSVTGGRWNP